MSIDKKDILSSPLRIIQSTEKDDKNLICDNHYPKTPKPRMFEESVVNK